MNRSRLTYLLVALVMAFAIALLLVYSIKGYREPPAPFEPAAAPRPLPDQAPPAAMYRGDLGRTGYFDTGAFDRQPAMRWSIGTGGPIVGESSPVVAEDMVYLLTTADVSELTRPAYRVILAEGATADLEALVLLAANAVSGRIEWAYVIGEPELVYDKWPVPAVADGTIYVGSGWTGELLALDAASGSLKWKFPAGGEPGAGQTGEGTAAEGYFPVVAAPAVADGTVWFGSWDGRLYALDAATGVEKWRFQTGGPVTLAPALAEGTLFIGSGDDSSPERNFYALDAASGALKWVFEAGGPAISTAAVTDGVVFFTSADRHLYAVDAGSGALRWKEDRRCYADEPAVAWGKVFVAGVRGDDEKNYCDSYQALDAATGELKWSYEDIDHALTSPIVAGETVIVGGRSSLAGLDARSGRELWRVTGRSPASSVIAGRFLYFGLSEGGVSALAAPER